MTEERKQERLTIGPSDVFRRFMNYRAMGYSALVAYLCVFERKATIELVYFPDPRRVNNRRHWQRVEDWATAVAETGARLDQRVRKAVGL